MASGNRVEELESRVKELEATVGGLTDELVECKVRIRELEDVVEGDGSLTAGRESGGHVDEVLEATGGESGGDNAGSEAESADTTKSEGDQGPDETESGESEIIIA